MKEGRYILYKRPTGLRRTDTSLSMASFAGMTFFFLTFTTAILLFIKNEYEAAATIFVLSAGITSYIFGLIINRQQQIASLTEQTLAALRDRWDELRNDTSLIDLLSNSERPDLDEAAKLKLRLFLTTLLDIYILIIRYIRRGYFGSTDQVAEIHENILKSMFKYSYFIEIWETRDVFGKGCLREEYDEDTVYVINNLISEIRSEKETYQGHKK